MMHFDDTAIRSLFSYEEFIPLLREYFTKDIVSPTRPHYPLKNKTSDPNTLLLMPAWQVDNYIGIKIMTVFKDNAAKGLNTLNGTYLLLDGSTGIPICTFDAPSITSKRTAATSALASSYLAPSDSKTYTILGTGQLCTELVQAHNSVFAFDHIYIWGRNNTRAAAKVEQLKQVGIHAEVAEDRSTTLTKSDIVSAATYSKIPIINGLSINQCTHVDLVGSYLPDHREADDALISKSNFFIDSEAALHETGDLVIPLAQGVLKESAIRGTLIQLCKGEVTGRQNKKEITLFKSVGYALEDLAIAIYLYQKHLKALPKSDL